MIGNEIGWLAPVINRLENGELDLWPTDEELSWIASLHDIGRIFGPLFSAIFLDQIGRKKTVILCSFLFINAWIMVVFANSVAVICASRIILGIVQGLSEVTSSIYVAENCTPHIRGILGSILPLCFFGGIIFEYVVASHASSRTMSLVNITIAIISLMTCCLLKETPYFLVMKERHEEAERNLLWLRGGDDHKNEVKLELDQIQQNIRSEKLKRTSVIGLLTNSENMRAMVIIGITSALVVLTGISAINAYIMSMIQSFTILGVDELTIYGIFQFMGACISTILMERFNRRTLLLIAVLFMSLCQGVNYILYALKLDSSFVHFSWLLFVTITLYSVFYTACDAVSFLIRSEALPTSVRAVGGSLSIIVDSIFAFTAARLYSPISTMFGIQYNFLFYFICGISGFIYIYMMLPETRGKSLTNIRISVKNEETPAS